MIFGLFKRKKDLKKDEELGKPEVKIEPEVRPEPEAKVEPEIEPDTSGKELVSDVMTKKVISVLPSTDLEKLADILLKNDISGVPVTAGEFSIGEISETDILKLVKKNSLKELTGDDRKVLKKIKVMDVMKKPVSITPKKSVEEARKKMEKYKIKRLIVVEKWNRLIGIVTRSDISKDGNVVKSEVFKGSTEQEIKDTVSTKIDDMLKLLEEEPADVSTLSKILEIPENLVEDWAKILEENGLVEITYPVMGSPLVRLKKEKV